MKQYDMKKMLLGILAGAALFFGMSYTIRYFSFTFWQALIFILGVQIVLGIIMMRGFHPKMLLKNAVLTVIIFTFMWYVTGLGFIGWMTGIIIFHVYFLWKRRRQMLMLKHFLEENLWGKPLKEFKTYQDIPKITIKKKDPKKKCVGR